MDLATKMMIIFSMVASIVCVKVALCAGKLYQVGDTAGWTTIGNIDYKNWASSKTFHVGDIIRFEYHPQIHNVMQVSFSDFRSCNATAPIKTYDTGNDSVAIKAPGHYYFICGISGHCQIGQKVDIRVTKTYHRTISPSLGPIPAPLASPFDLIAPSPSVNKAASILDSKWAWLSVFSLAVYIYGFA